VVSPVVPPADSFDDALDAYVDAVPPRVAVPSPRQLASGAAPEGFEYRPAPRPPEPPKTNPFRSFVESMRDLNPRRIAPPGLVTPLVALGLLSTVGIFDNLAFASVLFLIQGDFGLKFGFVLTVQSVLGIMATISSPLGGYLADRMSRVRLVQIGSLLHCIPSILTGLAPGVGFLTATRVAAGVGPAVSGPAIPSLLADYFPVEKRARVFGFMYMAGQVYATLSGAFILFAVYLGGWVSWRQLLVGSGVLTTAVALTTLRLKEPIRGEQDRLAMGASPEAAMQEQKPVSWGEAWRTARSIGTLRKLWYATPFTTVAQGGIGTFLFFAIQQKLAVQDPGGLFANPTVARLLPAIFIVVPRLIGGLITPFAVSLADTLMARRPGRVMYFAGILQLLVGLSGPLVLLIPNFFVAIVVVSFIGAIGGLIQPAQAVLMSVVIPARIRAQGFQTLAPWQVVGLLILPLLTVFGERYGATVMVFLLTPVMIVGCLILTSSGANVERDIRAALAASVADEESRKARARGANKMVVLRDVDVAYDGAQVLFNVDFDVEEGELVALLGTNGAGKSTLLRAICGIQEARNGAVFLDGEDITHKPPYLNARDGIVFLPGGRAVFPTLTVAENLRAAAWLYKDDNEYVERRTEEVLDYFPLLRERFGVLAGNLSGGEQQQLALGQAFLMRPRLLMIDELSLGLAPAIVERLLDIVRAIHAQGTTVILVEQSVNVALTIAERAVFMEKGQIRFDGPTEELLGRGDLVRAVFLGTGAGGFTSLGTARPPAYDEEIERVLDVADVSLSYGGVRALDGVSLHVEAGEIVGIVGPNGAGKTSLFDVISGFGPMHGGTVAIGGVDASGLSPDARAKLGLARSFQDTRLFPSLTVRETIAVALTRRLKARNSLLAATWAPAMRKSERRAARRVESLIDLLNLGAFADKFVNELSTGSRRVVDLACVLATDPKILLLDEPSSGMAQGEIEMLGPMVQRLAREAQCGVLVIEHDMPLISEMSDRLIAMELGRVLLDGPPADVLDDPRVKSAYLSASDAVINRSGELFQRAVAALDLPVVKAPPS
jgi:branched-chain amino acid transport system ATP-binding protein